MDFVVFEEYFNRTIWKGTDSVPAYDELKKMENDCFKTLFELKKHDYEEFKVLFVRYGQDVVSRITFCNKKIADGDNVGGLLSSYNRFLKNLKAIDRVLYENRLRSTIQDGKKRSAAYKRKAETQPVKKQNEPVVNKEEQVPHFTNLKIDVEKAAILYDKLVDEHFLEDTGKDDFIYYYTGKGKQASRKLHWLGDGIVLSVLMKNLFPNERVQWKVVEQIFENLNIQSMRAKLSNSKNNSKSAYHEHLKHVAEWLK